MKDKILEYVKSHGPCTPVEIAQKLSLNSMIASAVTADLIGKGILKSRKNVGSQNLYFTPSQADKARIRIFQSMEEREQRFLKELQNKKVILEGDYQNRLIEEFSDFLEEFDFGDKRAWKWFEISSSEALDALKRRLGKSDKPKSEAKAEKLAPSASLPKPVKLPLPKPAQRAAKIIGGESYADIVVEWLESQGAKVGEVEEIKKDKYWRFTASVPTPLGSQKYLVIVIKETKREAGAKDIKAAFDSAVKDKLPVIMVSSTGFAKSAEKSWSKDYRNMISLVDARTL
ncbi:MAG: hypothetical protein ABH829_00545 [archaeon]